MGTLTLGGVHCEEKNIKLINAHNMSFKPEKRKGSHQRIKRKWNNPDKILFHKILSKNPVVIFAGSQTIILPPRRRERENDRGVTVDHKHVSKMFLNTNIFDSCFSF